MNILYGYLIIGAILYLIALGTNETIRKQWSTQTIISFLSALVFIILWGTFPIGALIKRIKK